MVDINASTRPFQFHLSSTLSNSILSLFNFVFFILYCKSHYKVFTKVGSCLRTCQNLGRHVFLLELDLDVYLELLQPLLDEFEEQTNPMEEENSDPDVPMQKKSRFNLDCE